MRSFEGQRSDNIAIKRSNKEKEMQLRQLREQLAGLRAHATPTLRASMEKKIAELEEELKGGVRPLRRD
jgi:hypothetical protein